ncbi:molybdopterin-binding protein [Clostridium tyrobutyricum]|uniref:molybdopterin-binding protein n=1 Tax=Clostridium tyrobutyricum TaxID=1519 RepID=UPI001C380D6C|nr:molybdopterin-binding protein [Clostridium tyrobutyricum]MBV4430030.1 molybdopterin-binding protein [Clostridium tyrobutyricum]
MKFLPVKEAEGMVLGHDMTQIIPGKYKGTAFKKGHVIKKEDIPILLNMGKEHIYIMEIKEGYIHENEAAIRMAKAAAGQGIEVFGPSEGKITLISRHSGLLKINYEALMEINDVEEISFATLHTNQFIQGEAKVAGTRIIPLTTKESKIKHIEDICKTNYPIVDVKPLKKLNIGIVTTGNEVFYKRIKDKFGPVIQQKFKELDCNIIKQLYARDDAEMIAKSITQLIEEGADMITVTGGMSVDPDDVTPTGIRKSGAQIISYGAPILPGSMFLLSYINEVPVLGLPGCVMYNKRTIFDLIVPRLAAGEKVIRKDIIKLGHGGLCIECEKCSFPNCGFGKCAI